MEPYILYGSKAIKQWFPDFYRRSQDTDIISKNASEHRWCDVHYLPSFEWLLNSKEHNINHVASPDALYTIKVSHSFWDIRWQKTLTDISFLQGKGCKLIPELYNSLYNGWLVYHKTKSDKARMNFDVPNERFFTKAVHRDLPHDLLHNFAKYYNEPLYKSIKKDQKMAAVDEEMFEKLSDGDKAKLCHEEIAVIAFERYIIPNNFNYCLKRAYKMSFKKNVIDLNKGFIPLFMINNYNQYFKHPPIGKLENISYHLQKYMRNK